MISLRESYKRTTLSYFGFQQGEQTTSDDTETRGLKRLAWAVIVRAIFDIIRPGTAKKDRQTAIDFLFKPFEPPHNIDPYSFQWLLLHIVENPDLWAEQIREAVETPSCVNQLKSFRGIFGWNK